MHQKVKSKSGGDNINNGKKWWEMSHLQITPMIYRHWYLLKKKQVSVSGDEMSTYSHSALLYKLKAIIFNI